MPTACRYIIFFNRSLELHQDELSLTKYYMMNSLTISMILFSFLAVKYLPNLDTNPTGYYVDGGSKGGAAHHNGSGISSRMQHALY